MQLDPLALSCIFGLLRLKKSSLLLRQKNNSDTGRSIYSEMGLSMPQGRVKCGDLVLGILVFWKTQKVLCEGLREIKARMGKIYIKILISFFVEIYTNKSIQIKSVQLNDFP